MATDPPGTPVAPCINFNLELERERTKEEKEREEVLHLFRCYTHTQTHTHKPLCRHERGAQAALRSVGVHCPGLGFVLTVAICAIRCAIHCCWIFFIICPHPISDWHSSLTACEFYLDFISSLLCNFIAVHLGCHTC